MVHIHISICLNNFRHYFLYSFFCLLLFGCMNVCGNGERETGREQWQAKRMWSRSLRTCRRFVKFVFRFSLKGSTSTIFCLHSEFTLIRRSFPRIGILSLFYHKNIYYALKKKVYVLRFLLSLCVSRRSWCCSLSPKIYIGFFFFIIVSISTSSLFSSNALPKKSIFFPSSSSTLFPLPDLS